MAPLPDARFSQSNEADTHNLVPAPDADVFDDLVLSGLEEVKAEQRRELEAQAPLLPKLMPFRPAADFDPVVQ